MNIYLLKARTYKRIEKYYQDELIDVYSSFERAKKFGIEFINKKLSYYCKNTSKSVEQVLEEENIDFEFSIIEENLEYAEKFDKELDIFEEIEELLVYEPTQKEYMLDIYGKITNIRLAYLKNQKDSFRKNSLWIKPNDLLKEAGTKFEVGDLVKIVKNNRNIDDVSYEYYPEYSDVYVVRYLPRRIEGQKYLRNTYALSEIRDEDFGPGIYTWEFHEEQIESYDEEIEENSPIDVIRKIIKKEMKVDGETWNKLKCGQISFREKDKNEKNYYKKKLNIN